MELPQDLKNKFNEVEELDDYFTKSQFKNEPQVEQDDLYKVTITSFRKEQKDESVQKDTATFINRGSAERNES